MSGYSIYSSKSDALDITTTIEDFRSVPVQAN